MKKITATGKYFALSTLKILSVLKNSSVAFSAGFAAVILPVLCFLCHISFLPMLPLFLLCCCVSCAVDHFLDAIDAVEERLAAFCAA